MLHCGENTGAVALCAILPSSVSPSLFKPHTSASFSGASTNSGSCSAYMLSTCLVVLNQSTSRLDGDRTSSASSTAERGMVKPMIRIDQQDYRRQDSRWEMWDPLLFRIKKMDLFFQ